MIWHLRMPDGALDIAVRVYSPGRSDRRFAATGGRVRSLAAVDTLVGGVGSRTMSGEIVDLAVPTSADCLHLESAATEGLLLGWVEAGDITVTGWAPLSIMSYPMNPVAGVHTYSLTVQSGRLAVSSSLRAGGISEGARITCEAEDATVVLGDTLNASDTRDLTIEGGHLKVVRGHVGPLRLINVDVLEIGDGMDPSSRVESVADAAKRAIASTLGYGLVTQVTGSVRELRLGHRAAIAGDSRYGFSAERVTATPTSEISGLDARSFNLYSSGVLRDVRRLGLWVPPSTHKARAHFEAEVRRKKSEPAPAAFELAHRRKQLLALAIATQQDGHTLSVLREAEKDARRASLSWQSRERMLLELWRWLLGYGERIGYPLVVASGLLILLGIGHIGWSRFWS